MTAPPGTAETASRSRPVWLTDRHVQATVVAVTVGFVVRVAWAWWATRTPQGANDPVTYLGLAERFAAGQGYVGPTGAPTAYFPPGYPVALGTLLWSTTKLGATIAVPTLAAAFNVALGTATVAVLALLAGRLFGWRVAAIAAWILALFPALIGYSSLILSEPLFLFLVSLALAIALWQPLDSDRPAVYRLAAASVILGAALLVRPVGALLVVALVIGLVLAGGGRLVWARVGLVVGLVALVLVPWAARNASVLDAGFTLSTNTGDNLCIGNNPQAGGTFGVPDECFADLPDQDGPAEVAEAARARTTQTRALEWIRANPLAQPRLVALRTAATFQNGHEFRWASQSYGADLWLDDPTVVLVDWIADVAWFGLIAMGLCGAPVLWDRRDPRRVVLLLSVVGLALAAWPFFGNARFGVPAVALLALPAALVVSALPGVWADARTADHAPASGRLQAGGGDGDGDSADPAELALSN